MKVVTAGEMRKIDKEAIENFGIDKLVLMENAGIKIAAAVENILRPPTNNKIIIFAGTGDNGGDAFVAARHLLDNNRKVKVYIIGDADKISGAAKRNLDILLNLDADVMQVATERDWDKVKIGLAIFDIVVDGLVGTGFHGSLQGDLLRVIKLINDVQKPVIAIDIPSGVLADSGKVESLAVKATKTVSFGLPKLGIVLYPGARFAGEVVVEQISLPQQLMNDYNIKQNLLTDCLAKSMLVKRDPAVHKGSCGKVLVIAGSNGMTGAAVLAASAALRTGAGVVTLAIAESLQDIVANKLTEVMTKPLPEMKKGIIGMSALPVLLELAKSFDVVEIGSGLGRDSETLDLVRSFVLAAEVPMVIDADALYALPELSVEQLADIKYTPILTPHIGEMAALTGKDIADVENDLIDIARQTAANMKGIIVLKSARTIVADLEQNVYINTRGNAGMATAGSGDVLAGCISALRAIKQSDNIYEAAVSGVYLHALAGDIAASNGEIGIVAGDIMKSIPAARKYLAEA